MRHFTGHGLAPLLTDTWVYSFSGWSLLLCNMQLHFCHVFLLFNCLFLFITKLHCIVWLYYSSFTYWLTSWLFLVRQLLLTLCTSLCGHSFQLFRNMLFKVCVVLYMYPVSEYITEIILVFSPSQKSLFLQVSFHFLFWTLSSMSEIFLRDLLIFCSYLKPVPQKAVQKPWFHDEACCFPRNLHQPMESRTLDRLITEERLPVVDGEGLVPFSGSCVGENISLQNAQRLLTPLIMEQSSPVLTALGCLLVEKGSWGLTDSPTWLQPTRGT